MWETLIIIHSNAIMGKVQLKYSVEVPSGETGFEKKTILMVEMGRFHYYIEC